MQKIAYTDLICCSNVFSLPKKLTRLETDVHNLPIQSHLSHAGFDRWDKA